PDRGGEASTHRRTNRAAAEAATRARARRGRMRRELRRPHLSGARAFGALRGATSGADRVLSKRSEGIVDHAVDAPACVERSADPPEPASEPTPRERIVDEYRQPTTASVRDERVPHAIRREHEHPRRADGLPRLGGGRSTLDDDF